MRPAIAWPMGKLVPAVEPVAIWKDMRPGIAGCARPRVPFDSNTPRDLRPVRAARGTRNAGTLWVN